MSTAQKIASTLACKNLGFADTASFIPVCASRAADVPSAVVMKHSYPTNSAALAALLSSPVATLALRSVNRQFGIFALTLVDAGQGLRASFEVREGVLFLRNAVAGDGDDGGGPAAPGAAVDKKLDDRPFFEAFDTDMKVAA